MSSRLESMKRDIKSEISKVRIKKRNKLRSKILKNDPSRKKFWSFLKDKMQNSGKITGMSLLDTVKQMFNQLILKQLNIHRLILKKILFRMLLR